MILLQNLLHQGKTVDLLIDGDKIAKIGPSLDVPGAEVLEIGRAHV